MIKCLVLAKVARNRWLYRLAHFTKDEDYAGQANRSCRLYVIFDCLEHQPLIIAEELSFYISKTFAQRARAEFH